ncbi:MAG: outer membrane beta-barrel protein [Bacteroidales bacterium]|nr:outer membrane beta-barrel protein [Bacteroidales bacterium]
MKKNSLLLALVFALGTFILPMTTNAQMFNQGDKDLNLGIGLGNALYTGSYYKTTLPPISVSLDYGFRDDIGPGVLGLGGYAGFSSYKYDYSAFLNYSWKITTIIIGARGTYHMEFMDNLDTYVGLLLGAKIVSFKYDDPAWEDYNTAAGSGLAYSFFVGGKYYFSDNIALMGELGYGIAWLTLGVTFKL